jgi:hypothetical protein
VITPSAATRIAGLKVVKARDRAKFINMMVYADSGVGKTQLLGSADEVPELRKVLHVDAEGGTMTLEHSYPNVDIVRVETWKECQEVKKFLAQSNHDYTSCNWDSLTEIQKMNMYAILGDPNRKDGLDPDVAGMREWGITLEQMRRFVRELRDLPINTFFAALVSEDKDPKTGIVQKKPGIPGKLRNEVAAFLDIVTYLYMREIPDPKDENKTIQVRLLLTGSTNTTVAKDRSAKLPMLVQQPTMKKIYNLLNQEKESQ